MHSAQHGHGIVNGHWEPSTPELPKVVLAVRTGVAKILRKISDGSAQVAERASGAPHEQHEPVAAE